MQLFVALLVYCSALFQVASAVPVGYYPYNINPQMYSRYVAVPCMKPGYLCYQMMQPKATAVTHVPLLRQKFITITRKHDNLNTAQASKRKSAKVKYQDGPSAEIEGEQIASVYSKQRGGEHRIRPMINQEQYGQMMPNTQMEPMQSQEYGSSN